MNENEICEICETCGGSNAEKTIDPYHQEVDGVEIECYLCADCYNKKVMDI